MRPVTDVQEAIRSIQNFTGPPEEFELSISDSLQDATGMSMALITDEVLSRGWEPTGCELKDGYRIYRYKVME
ncbi:MAG: hypothetical protein OEY86_03680 [Nitrospira sp.]|nr:hypothetical protein [Nitrospira sp.]